MNNEQSVPHRFRESSFRRYEKHIALIVDRFPETVTITPGGDLPNSGVTVVSRLRDAIHAYDDENWPSVLINQDKFESIGRYIICAERSEGIICGSKEQIKLYDMLMTHKEDGEGSPQTVKRDLEPYKFAITCRIQVEVIIELAYKGLLNRPICLTGYDDTAIFETLDLAIISNPDGTTTILP